MKKLFFLPLALLLIHSYARAFDYLEHSFFADRGCRIAQEVLSKKVANGDDALASRYLALALVCPNRWPDPEKAPYCAANGYKRLESNVNRLEGEADGVAFTLGDLAAVPDHVSRFGPVRGLPKVEDKWGLMNRFFGWISNPEKTDIGGVIGDVSEDACEGVDQVPWVQIEKDVQGYNGPINLSGKLLSPLSRAPIPRGPSDQPGAYSFDNPHFLDLVLRDNHHFGEHAFAAWVGYHSTGVDLATRPCEEIIGFSASSLRNWSQGLAEFENLNWGKLGDADLRRQGCAMLGERLKARLKDWEQLGDPVLVNPARSHLSRLDRELLDRVTASVIGLVIEGSGLHFLQDGLSSGHMRAIHGKRGLRERRYDHDADSRDGVTTIFRTAEGDHAFVAFGDSYLLGADPRGTAGPSSCDWNSFSKASPDPAVLAACLTSHQRGVLASATAASLLDWSLGGYLVDSGSGGERCGRAGNASEDFVCRNLPLAPPRIPGMGDNHVETVKVGQRTLGRPPLVHGVLPVPPPPFAYESLSFQFGLDAGGSGNQIGLSASMYSELNRWADWMWSHSIGVRSTLPRDSSASSRATLEYSFGFHWRWAARFVIDGAPFVFAGMRNARNGRELAFGVGPRIGITVLPEGWVKIPIEASVSYRHPLTLYGTRSGFMSNASDQNIHWIQLGVGLAFM